MDPAPPRVHEYADQVVAYVQRALGVKLEYDSNTLPVLDHYLRSVPADQPAALELVIVTASAYFGEVVRRLLGGRWETTGRELEWRVVLPTAINFSPAGFVATAIAQDELDDFDAELTAPPRMLTHLQEALSRMGEASVEEYYSLCGRLDTLEHVHEVLVAVAAQMMGASAGVDDEADDEIAELGATRNDDGNDDAPADFGEPVN
jgi:hypothetical protein